MLINYKQATALIWYLYGTYMVLICLSTTSKPQPIYGTYMLINYKQATADNY